MDISSIKVIPDEIQISCDAFKTFFFPFIDTTHSLVSASFPQVETKRLLRH